jgi:ATP-dependent DNA helicase RecG
MNSPVAAKSLDQISVQQLKGVGPKLAEKLAGLGIHSIQALLFHLPLRYQDRTRVTPIAALRAGQDVVIEGEIKAADVVFGRRRSLVCRLQDGSGTVTLRFFHFSNAQKQSLSAGTRLRCYGEARRGSSGLELYHPEYHCLDEHAQQNLEQHLTPIYPSSDGLSQQSWRKLCQQALDFLNPQLLQDWLPEAPRLPNPAGLEAPEFTLEQALRYLHLPPPAAPVGVLRDGMHPCQRRLAFEELVAHNLSMQKLRQAAQRHAAPALSDSQQLLDRFLQQLPFALTTAQQRVVDEIITDVAQIKPMLRLVQGDVGSGKTVVAAAAALLAISTGYQVAIMAPTEILAEQHFANFQQWLQPLGLELAWLSGKLKGKARQQQLDLIAQHQAQLVVGTHALFQDEVQFAKLGLVIIDEQHRFGVHQRLALKEKAAEHVGQPHQLIMTATPIPRTLAMSAYADLDTSVIDELPPGRTPINTVVLDNSRREQVIERIRHACAEGRQAYWVCTLIEESETLSAQAAEHSWQLLQQSLPELRIGLVHGRLKADQKAAMMAAFKAHQLDLLVATTVIEVGVDVPNASLMIIENAERLGLAQLHQLRGRVGRGDIASHCLLLYQSPLSKQGKQRLQIMRENSNGFVIAEQDLLMRGPGELLGTRQTGLAQLRIADLQRDSDLLDSVNAYALLLIRNYPSHCQPLIQRWLGNADRYAQV